MTKDEQHKVISENWKKFVNESPFETDNQDQFKASKPTKKELADMEKALQGATFDAPSIPGSEAERLKFLKRIDPNLSVGPGQTLRDVLCGLLTGIGFWDEFQAEAEKKKGNKQSLLDQMKEWADQAIATASNVINTPAAFLVDLFACKAAKKILKQVQDKKKDPKDPKKPKKVNNVKVKLPKCDDNDRGTVHNKGCWQYYYTRSAKPGDSKEENNKKIADAKRKAKQHIQKQRVKNALSNWKKDEEFLNKVKNWSNKNDVPMKNILAVMLHETGGSMSPSETNKIGCVGLIQFCKKARTELGVSSGELKNMTRAKQWDYVEKFFASKNAWKKNPKSISTLYLSVFLPAFAHLPDDAILATESGTDVHSYVAKIRDKRTIASDWESNPANRDKSKKGSPITKAGLASKLQRRADELTAFDKPKPAADNLTVRDNTVPPGIGGSM
jgi:hypothetical protein